MPSPGRDRFVETRVTRLLRGLLAGAFLLLSGACDLGGDDACEGSGPCGGAQGPLFALEGAERRDDHWRLDFGQVAVGESLRVPLQVHNGGSAPLRVRLHEEAPAPFSTEAGEIEVGAKKRASLEVAFAPQQRGPFEATLELRTNVEGGAVERLRLVGSGVGEAGALTVHPPGCLQLGEAPIHSRAQAALTLQNLGDVPLEIVSLYLAAGQGDFRLILPPVPPPWILQPMEAREVLVEYRPTKAEAHEGSLLIRTDDPLHPERAICLAGAGQGRVACTPSLDFERVWLGASETRSAACRILGEPGAPGAPPYLLQSLEVVDGPCFRATLRNPDGSEGPREEGYGPGDTFQVEVRYEPEEEEVDWGLLLLRGEDEPEVAISLEGSGRRSPPCQFDLEPRKLDFGAVHLGNERRGSFSVTNRMAEGVCHLEELRLSEDGSLAFSLIDERDAVLGPGERRSFELRFAPQQAEDFSGRVTFTLSTAEREPQTVELSGTGMLPCHHVSPSEVDFGPVALGCRSRQQTVSFFNHCDDTMWIDELWLVDAPGVRLLQDLPQAVPPGGRFEFPLRYEPEAEGALDGRLRIKPRGAASFPVPLRGGSAPGEMQTDTFPGLAAPRVDVLWVIDNSPIDPAPSVIGGALSHLVGRALELGTDFHLGVTTSGLTPAAGGCPGGRTGARTAGSFRWTAPRRASSTGRCGGRS